MAIVWADDNLEINTCENKDEWSGFGDFGSPDENTALSDVPMFIQGSKCMQSSMDKEKAGGWYYNFAAGHDISGKVLIWPFWFPSKAAIGALSYFRVKLYNDVDQGGDWSEWYIDLATLRSGWNYIAIYPTQPDDNSVTPLDNTDVKCFEINASNTDPDIVIKICGWDYVHALSYIQASADSAIDFDDFFGRSEAQVLCAIAKDGAVYKSLVDFRLGAAGSTTAFSDTLKILQFDMRNDDHKIGFQFIASTSLSFTLGALTGGNPIDGCLISYPVGIPTATSDIFTNPGNADTFKLYDTSFINAKQVDLPTASANREVLGCKFAGCGEIYASTCKFEDNTIVNADDAVSG